MAEKKSYYEILGIPKGSSKDVIKDAYRKLAMQYHPDRNKSPGAEEKFKEISEAYAVLSDDEKRKQFDNLGRLDLIKDIVERTFFEGLISIRYFVIWVSALALGIFLVFSLMVKTLSKEEELFVVETWATKFT